MIKDKPNRLASWLAAHVGEWLMLRHFARLKFIGKVHADRQRSCMVLMNHFSFNDGAFIYNLCRKILKKRFKVMIVESQLRAFSWLKYVGCFSIDKKSRAMVESLNHAAGLLNDPANMLAIYPQGELYSMHLNRVHFEGGLEYIFKRSRGTDFQVFFGVVLLDYLDARKPIARVYLEEYHGERQTGLVEEAYNSFYTRCKLQQQSLHNPPQHILKAGPIQA